MTWDMAENIPVAEAFNIINISSFNLQLKLTVKRDKNLLQRIEKKNSKKWGDMPDMKKWKCQIGSFPGETFWHLVHFNLLEVVLAREQTDKIWSRTNKNKKWDKDLWNMRFWWAALSFSFFFWSDKSIFQYNWIFV